MATIGPAFSGEHYWINVEADLRNLSKAPRRAAVAWRPPLAPWRKSLRQLASSVFIREFFG
ncbi:MAG TPA: hypothetical protein VFR66_14170 [Burkholderiales bacterium]|nr:hypothetical protein [Burkholderiales bacterium]